MKDLLLTKFLEDFCTDIGIDTKDESTAFEHFANYCVLDKFIPTRFDPTLFNIGGNGNFGIDGLAIIVNEIPICTIEELNDVLQKGKRHSVDFVFVQAKTSASTDSGDLLKTLQQ